MEVLLVEINDFPKDYHESVLLLELKEQAKENGETTISIIKGMPFKTRDRYPSAYSFVCDDTGDISSETINDHELFMEYLENYRFWGFKFFHVEFLVHYIYFVENKQQIIDIFPELKILKIFNNFDISCPEKTKMKCIATKEFKLIKLLNELIEFCHVNDRIALTIMIMNGDEEVFDIGDLYLRSMFELNQWKRLLYATVNFNLARYASNINIYSANELIEYTTISDTGAKNIQNIQNKINEQIYEFVDVSKFAKDPIDFIKKLKERLNIEFNLEALAWAAVGGHPKCLEYIIENLPFAIKSFKLCDIAAMNNNVECVDIAKNAGFDSYIDLYSLIENNNIACLEYSIINNLVDLPNEWNYIYNPSKEALVLIHKYNIDIPRCFIVKTIETTIDDFNEYFEFFNQVGFTFMSEDYNHIKSSNDIVNLHNLLKIPFSFKNSHHFYNDFYWNEKNVMNLNYIDCHGGIDWNDFKIFMEKYQYARPSSLLIELAVEKGIEFDKGKVSEYALNIIQNYDNVHKCKKHKT